MKPTSVPIMLIYLQTLCCEFDVVYLVVNVVTEYQLLVSIMVIKTFVRYTNMLHYSRDDY
jgi:hypothetical protein